MSQWIPVSNQEHQHYAWRRQAHYQHAATAAVAPVVLAELTELLPEFPLAFAITAQHTSEQQSAFQLVALQGLRQNENQLLNADHTRWKTRYIPACFRTHPFKLLRETNSGQMLLCMDQHSDALIEQGQSGDIQLFNHLGQLSPEIQQIADFLRAWEQSRQLTQALTDQLVSADLLQAWAIQLTQPDGSTLPVQGLYRVNEAALRNLDAQTLQSITQSGAASLVYAQLLSQTRLKNLEALYNQQNAAALQEQQQEVNLDQLFGESDDDLFRF